MRLLNDVGNKLVQNIGVSPDTRRKFVHDAQPKRKFNLKELCARLHEIFGQDEVDVEELKGVMEQYDHTLGEWKDYLYFDPNRYTRNLVDAGNRHFNVIVLAWSEDQGSPIHDHAGSHCVMKIVDGSLRETQFEWPTAEDAANNKPLTVKEANDHDVGAVAYIHDKIGLHRVENKSHSKKAVSLHVYCPPILECERFDERTSKHSRVGNMTFFSVNGQKLSISEPARNFSS